MFFGKKKKQPQNCEAYLYFLSTSLCYKVVRGNLARWNTKFIQLLIKKKKLHVICVRNMIALEFDDIVLEIYVPISKYHKVI